MKSSKVAITAIAVVVLFMGVLLERESASVRELKRQAAELNAQIADKEKAGSELSARLAHAEQISAQLNAKLADTVKGDSLDLQAKCAVQARKDFEEWGYINKESADFQSHYNRRVDKCFIQTQNSVANHEFLWRELFDAYGGKKYGQYAWQMQKGKKYWEVPPFVCDVTFPSGETKECRSEDEFGKLVKIYMEN